MAIDPFWHGFQKHAKDLIHGGLADDIPTAAFDKKELVKGRKVEHEHTDSDAIATEISKDHLTEDPDYYEKLEKMEKKSFFMGFEKAAKKTSDVMDEWIGDNKLADMVLKERRNMRPRVDPRDVSEATSSIISNTRWP